MDINTIKSKWVDLLEKVFDKDDLTELQVSSLCTIITDCHKSFEEIYHDLLLKVANADHDDYEKLFDTIIDIYWTFKHIQRHIEDADIGFEKLISKLDELSSKIAVDES